MSARDCPVLAVADAALDLLEQAGADMTDLRGDLAWGVAECSVRRCCGCGAQDTICPHEGIRKE